MAKRVHRRTRKNPRGKRRRTIGFRKVRAKLYRRNPGGFLASVFGLIKEGGPGAIGAAALDLYGIEPLLVKFNCPRALQPVAKVAVGLAACVVADKYAPKYRKHAEAAAIGLMAIAAKEAIGRMAGHPKAKIEDVADYYKGLSDLVEVPASMGMLTDGGVESAMDHAVESAFGGWPEVYA